MADTFEIGVPIATVNGYSIGAGLREARFETASDLLDAIRPNSGFFGDLGPWIFRGHADSRWRLLPSVHRASNWLRFAEPMGPAFDPDSANVKQRIAKESELARDFLESCDTAGLSVPGNLETLRDHAPILPAREWPHRGLVPLLALGQHYGLPTCLLDWTRLGRVAAYFAALPHESDELVVWALNARIVHGWEHEPFSFHGATIHLASAPRASNPNLHAQAGVFTFCRYIEDRLLALDEVIMLSLSRQAGRAGGTIPTALWKLRLPRSEAARLQALVSLDGVSAMSLFPGYTGVVRNLEERRSLGLQRDILWL
jgi:hypothetical protein